MHGPSSGHPPDCFGCKVKTIQVSPFAMPSRLHPENAPKREPNSFNRGIVRNANGSPYHRPDGSVIGLAELAGNHRAIEREIRDRHEAGRAGCTPDQPRDRAGSLVST